MIFSFILFFTSSYDHLGLTHWFAIKEPIYNALIGQSSLRRCHSRFSFCYDALDARSCTVCE